MDKDAKWKDYRRRLIATRLIAAVAVACIVVGCQHGDFRATVVAAGDPAPHNGYNVGPDLYVTEGRPVPVTGAVVWIKGLDPNDLTP